MVHLQIIFTSIQSTQNDLEIWLRGHRNYDFSVNYYLIGYIWCIYLCKCILFINTILLFIRVMYTKIQQQKKPFFGFGYMPSFSLCHLTKVSEVSERLDHLTPAQRSSMLSCTLEMRFLYFLRSNSGLITKVENYWWKIFLLHDLPLYVSPGLKNFLKTAETAFCTYRENT